MSGTRPVLRGTILGSLLIAGITRATPQVVRIDGSLYDSSGIPQSVTPDLQLKVYDASTSGSLLWVSPIYNTATTNGKFSIPIDASVSSRAVDYWTFDGTLGAVTAGATIPASVGSNGVATSQTTMSYVAGHANQALSFAAGHDDVRVTMGAPATNAYSVSFWINLTSFPATVSEPLSATNGGAVAWSIVFTKTWTGDGQAGNYEIGMWQSTAAGASSSVPNTFGNGQLGAWHHVAITYNSSASPTTLFYLDGNQLANDLHGMAGNFPTIDTFWIGGYRGDGNSCCNSTGSIDEVTIWNTTLTTAQVTQLYQGQTLALSLTGILSSLANGIAPWFELHYDAGTAGNSLMDTDRTVKPRFRTHASMYSASAASTAALRGTSVSNSIPATNNLLYYNGTQWTPASLNSIAGGVLFRAGDSMSGALSVGSNVYAKGFVVPNNNIPGSFVLADNGSQGINLRAPSALGSNVYFTFPSNAGASSYMVSTDGSGGLSWRTNLPSTNNFSSGGTLFMSSSPQLVGSATGISVATASVSSNGVVVQEDWNTFNGKQNAIGYSPLNRNGDTMSVPLLASTLSAATVNVASSISNSALITDVSGNVVATSIINIDDLAQAQRISRPVQDQLNSFYAALPAQSGSPNAFSFSNRSGVAGYSAVTSNQMTLGGFTGVLTGACSGCTAIVRNGVVESVATQFLPGDTIALQVLASGQTLGSVTAALTIGATTSTPWVVTSAGSPSTAPLAFAFTNQTGVMPGSTIMSNGVQVSGFTGGVNVSCISASGCINVAVNGVWGVTTGIVAGNYIAIEQTSSSSTSTLTSVTVMVGSTSSAPWTVTTKSSADPCAGSPSSGTVCSDGSVYVGLSPDGNVPMYTTPCDVGQSWNGSSCTGSVLTKSWNDGSGNTSNTAVRSGNLGKANTATLVGLGSTTSPAPFRAAQFCATLSFGGHSDWYLPAINELNLMYLHYSAIGGFSAGIKYWSSTETLASSSVREILSTGDVGNSQENKSNALNLRCVRR